MPSAERGCRAAEQSQTQADDKEEGGFQGDQFCVFEVAGEFHNLGTPVRNPSRSFQALAASCLSVAPFHLAMEALRLEAPVREGQENSSEQALDSCIS